MSHEVVCGGVEHVHEVVVARDLDGDLGVLVLKIERLYDRAVHALSVASCDTISTFDQFANTNLCSSGRVISMSFCFTPSAKKQDCDTY